METKPIPLDISAVVGKTIVRLEQTAERSDPNATTAILLTFSDQSTLEIYPEVFGNGLRLGLLHLSWS